MTKILIISRNQIQIEKWRRTLTGKYSIEISSNITSDIPSSEHGQVSLVVLDADLIEQNLHTINNLVNTYSKVLISGIQWPESKQVLALAAGASGYCERNINFSLFLKAISCILKGEIWVQRHLVFQVIEALANTRNKVSSHDKTGSNEQEHLGDLSTREIDVVKMIRLGENNKKIALSLHISERTVKAHLTSIFRKVNVPDRLHLALMFKESNF